jgi:transcriptional regulator with XRE-family HTH domain
MSGEWSGERFGAFIKRRRLNAKLTADALGVSLGKGVSYVADLEREKVVPRDGERLAKIANKLNIDLCDLHSAALVSCYDLRLGDHKLGVQKAAELFMLRDSRARVVGADEIKRVPPRTPREIAEDVTIFCKDSKIPLDAHTATSALPICDVIKHIAAHGMVKGIRCMVTFDLDLASEGGEQTIVEQAQGADGAAHLAVRFRSDLWQRARLGHPRARMSCAHALAHAVMHGAEVMSGRFGRCFVDVVVIGTKLDAREALPYQCPEEQANIWAQELLMPPAALTAALRMYEGFDGAPIEELAARFGVTPSVMLERLEHYMPTARILRG